MTPYLSVFSVSNVANKKNTGMAHGTLLYGKVGLRLTFLNGHRDMSQLNYLLPSSMHGVTTGRN